MTTDWGALQRVIEGDVVLPGSADYESVRKPVMARFEDLRPAAVVRCATPADVAATLAVARELRLPTAIGAAGTRLPADPRPTELSSTSHLCARLRSRRRWRP